MDEAIVLVNADVDLPLRGPAATCRNTINCPSLSGASPDPSRPSCSSASGTLGLRPRKGGAGCRDQGGIDDRSLLHGHAVGLEVGLHRLKDLLPQIVLLQQVPERQDRGLIRNPLSDQVDPCKSAHDRYLDQRILHGWIAQVIPLLHQMDPEHCLQRIGRASALGAALGVVGLNQIDQRLPGHNLLHPSQKLLTFGALLCCGLLIVTEPQLLATHEPCPYLRSQGHCPVNGVAFPESP